MRDLQPLVQLITTFVFGIAVLVLLALLTAQMAAHHFQLAAERTVRHAFAESGPSQGEVRHEIVCRESDGERTRVWRCDPLVVKAQHPLRSVSCGGGSLLRFVGRRWSCDVAFADGATLRARVSLGIGPRRLELVLPVRDPGALSDEIEDDRASPALR